MSPLTPAVSDRDHASGPADAPITLVEYGDYECPYCGAAQPVVQALERHFGDRMRFVFRHFPLTQIHPHAERAAEAAEAAGAAGKFWPMHETIFAHQRALRDDDLRRYATDAGVPGAVIVDALANHTFEPRVREDFMSGVRSGVNGTPSFFINDEKYEGPYEYDALRDAIDEVLVGG